jgi:hypothetical protein
VLRPSYPFHLRDQKYYFSGRVIAVFECKLTLKKEHLNKFFKTVAEIKRKSSFSQTFEQFKTPYHELFKLPIVGLLSHSHIWRSRDASEAIYDRISEFENEFVEHPRELPDVICVADAATFTLGKIVEIGKEVPMEILEDIQAMGMKEAVSVMYSIYDDEPFGAYELNRRGRILASLIFSVIRWMAREDESLRPWADHLEAALGTHLGIGRPTFWSAEILPKAILQKVRRSGFALDRWSPWNRWI